MMEWVGFFDFVELIVDANVGDCECGCCLGVGWVFWVLGLILFVIVY